MVGLGSTNRLYGDTCWTWGGADVCGGDAVFVQIPKPVVKEGSAFTALAYFRRRDAALAGRPTNVYYRLDNLTVEREVADWTSIESASQVSIAITAAHNAILHGNRRERMQLTVALDYGLPTQASGRGEWDVLNLYGSP